MLAALALTLACSAQELPTEQSPELLGDTPEAETVRASDALEVEADQLTLDLEHRFLGACAALGGSAGMEAGRSAAAEVFLPPFLVLARAGNPRAIVWCLEHQEAWHRQGEPHPAQRAVRRSLWEALFACALHQQPLLQQSGAIEWLAREGVLARIESVSLAERFGALTLDARLRAMALYAQARLIAPWDSTDPERVDEGVALFRRAITLVAAGDPLVQTCKDAIFRLQELGIGCPAPAFTSEDAHGNEIRLGDYLGKVVLIRFWSFLDDRARERLEADRLRVRGHWDDRFALVGVNSDTDPRAFVDRCEDMEIHWPNAREAAACDESRSLWPVDSPATILLDAKGIVRGIDLEGRALDVAIQELVRDLELRRSSERRTDSPEDVDGASRR